MQIKPNVNLNSPSREHLLKLARHEIEPTLEELNSLDWLKTIDIMKSPKDYVHLLHTKSILQDEADKLAEAQKAEADKQAGMNPVRRAFYKTIQKPVGDWWNKHFKKEPKARPVVKQMLSPPSYFNN
jgi:hypothetical protein